MASPFVTVGSLALVLVFVLRRAFRNAPSAGSKLGAVLAIAAGIAPAIWVVGTGHAPVKIVVGYGVLFFIGAVLLKWTLFGLLDRRVYPHFQPATTATAQGVLSSACEMGFALIAFAAFLRDLSFWHVFGFGAGAAAVEALIVTGMVNPFEGATEGRYVDGELAKLDKGPPWLAAALPFAERIVATVDHIACRGLIALAVSSESLWPGAFAFTTFALTDGLVGYALRRRWEFSRPAVATRLFGILAVIAASTATVWGLAL